MTSAGEIRPAVYWFWNQIPTDANAAAQLTEIAEAGFGTVLIQARLSFPREQYLQPRYLDAYRKAVQQAKLLGLKVGVYDDYAWISGHGGGRTVDGADHLRERHLFWTTSTTNEATISGIDSWWVDGFGGPEKDWLYDDGIRRWDEWELVAALAHPPNDTTPIDVTDQTTISGHDDGCTITVNSPQEQPRDWTITAFVSARCASSRMVNYLDPETAQRFIETTYEPYARALDGLLGDPVTFFSFDHPYGGFYQWPQTTPAQIGNSLMWNRSMAAETARIANDQPLAHTLHQIVYGTTDHAKSIRVAFFRRYAQRGIQSFFEPLRTWADAHGVGLSGHELLAHVGGWDLNGAFPEVDARSNFGLDYFAVDAYRTETLVDASNFNAQISPKFGDSLARAHGRHRCTVEQYAARNDGPGHYAGGYWELSLDELRLQTLRLHLLGARQLIFHAYGQSDGTGDNSDVLTNPRFDFPPTCNFEPWFTYFRAYTDESAAITSFIDGAEPVRTVALVYPLHTLWAEGPKHAHSQLTGAWAELLAREGVGFDLVDDRALATATVQNGEIILDDHRYRAVIMAGVTRLPSPQCTEATSQLAAAGGVVIVTDTVPEKLPDRLRDSPIAITSDHGTLWSWQGRDGEEIRVVLLNDGELTCAVTLEDSGTEFQLGPEQVLCLRIDADGVPHTSYASCPTAALEPALVPLDQGWLFHARDATTSIDIDRGWEQQGFETFGGEGTYTTTFDAPRTEGLVLDLPEVHCAVSAAINGTELGARAWRPFRFVIPPGILRSEGNTLTVKVTNSAANRYYAGTPFQAGLQPSGLTAAPILRIQSTEEGP